MIIESISRKLYCRKSIGKLFGTDSFKRDLNKKTSLKQRSLKQFMYKATKKN